MSVWVIDLQHTERIGKCLAGRMLDGEVKSGTIRVSFFGFKLLLACEVHLSTSGFPLDAADCSLVAAARDGDGDAAARLYERYAKRVFGLVESQMGGWLRSATQSEDIVQSVFKSLFRGVGAGSYDAPQGNSLWNLLAVIAVHKLRRKASQQTAERRDIRRNVSLESLVEGDTVDRRGVELIEMTIREALEAMREVDRQILLLRIQGHTVNEISGSVGRSRRTVERSLGNSRRMLADRLLEGNEVAKAREISS